MKSDPQAISQRVKAVTGIDLALRPMLAGCAVGCSIEANRVLHVWDAIAREAAHTGHWPVVLGPEPGSSRVEEFILLKERAIQDILADAELLWSDPAAYAEEQAAASAARIEALAEPQRSRALEYERALGEDLPELPPDGAWPEAFSPARGFATPFSRGATHPNSTLVLVPTTAGWQVPAYLSLGGWNDCPPAEVHCVNWRRWEADYGARPVCVTGDVVEFDVARPPTTRDAALALAREQYTYCADIVDQGTGTIAALAATLLNGTSWYFWWD